MSDHECFRCPECGSCPACAADALDRVIDEAESLRERLDQFEAYAMPNVATALDRIAAAEARAEKAERERDAYRHEWNVASRQQGAETRARYAAEARAERLAGAAKKLRDKMQATYSDPRYMNVWAIAQAHVGPYTGHDWIAEAEALDAALAEEVRR